MLEIKGIGLISVSRFLAEVGDIRRFDSPKQIQKLAGLGIELGENARQALLKYDQERTVLKDKLRKQQEIITEEILEMYQSINSYLDNNIEIIEPQIKTFTDTSEIRYETTKYDLDFKELNENLIENKLKELQSKIDNELEVFLQEDMLQSLSDSDGILRDIPSRLSINNNATIDEFNPWSNNEKLDTLKNYVSVGRSKKTEYLKLYL